MADRRYNREQKSRVVTSGEAPPSPDELSLMPAFMQRAQKNIMVAIPRAATDMLSMAGMAVPAARAAMSSDLDFGEAVYGKEGLAQANEFFNSEYERLTSQLPEHKRTPNNLKAIEDAIQGSDQFHEILSSNSPALMRAGEASGDFVNDLVGLQPVHKETITDDIEQIAGGAIVPTGALTKTATGIAEAGAGRALRHVADAIIPGTANYTGKGIAANVAAQTAVSQGLRAATDSPSVITGDALAADNGVDTAYVADPDDNQGMGAEQYFAMGGSVLGAAVVGAAVMSGKVNKAAINSAMDELDKVGKNTPEQIAEFEHTPTRTQKLKADFVDSSAPLRDTVREAHDYVDSADLETKISDLERVAHDTANVNINTATQNAYDLGMLPGTDIRTVPTTKMRQLFNTLAPEEQELWSNASVAGTLLDRHSLRLQNAEQMAADAKLGIKRKGGVDRVAKAQTELDAASAETGKLANDMSVAEAKAVVAQMKANLKLATLDGMYRKVVNDIPEAHYTAGQLPREIVDELKREHPNFMPLQERSDAKWWNKLYSDWMGHTPDKLFKQNRAPIRQTEEKGSVKADKPMHPLDALDNYIRDFVEYTKLNDATRSYVNAIKGTKAYGKTIKHVESMSLQDFRAKGKEKSLKDRDDIFAFTEGGQIHFYTTKDKQLLRALQFNAPATATGFNLTRKWKQMGVTGIFRPVFAFTSMKYDHEVIRGAKKSGRVYGPVHVALNHVAPNSKMVQSIIDNVADPLAAINMYAALGKTLSVSAIKKAADSMAEGLISDSGMAGLIAKSPGGREILTRASESMLRAYNESRYAMFVEYGIKRAQPNADPISTNRMKYDAAENLFKSQGYISKELRGVREFGRDMLGMLDQIQNAPKYAFFAQNVARLERMYGSRAAIPPAELDKLAKETKLSSGDMTRAPGSPAMSKSLSAIPYGHIMVNSTYHLASAARHDPTGVGLRVLTGAVLPKVMGIMAIGALGGPALQQWYWDEIPSWERIGKTPVVGPDWLIDAARGNVRPLTEADVYLVPDAPEFIPITSTFNAFFRSMGVFGDKGAKNSNFSKDFGEGLQALTGVATPPVLGVVTGGANVNLGNAVTGMLTGDPVMQPAFGDSPHQGAAGDMINADSVFSHSFANMMTAVFGTAINQVINSTDVGVQAWQNGDPVDEAFRRAFAYEGYQSERSMPETPGTREASAYLYTNGQRRRYSSTQQRERVTEVQQAFEPIARQLSADKDKRGRDKEAVDRGMQPIANIQDPTAKAVAQQMYHTLNAGRMFILTKKRSDSVNLLAHLDASKDIMDPSQYHLQYDAIMREMNEVNAQQESILDGLEVDLHRKYGLDIRGAIQAIEGAISR